MQLDSDGMDSRGDPHRHRLAFGQEFHRWRRRRGVALRRLAGLIDCSLSLVQ
jgi:hypothetical protein